MDSRLIMGNDARLRQDVIVNRNFLNNAIEVSSLPVARDRDVGWLGIG